MNIAKKSWFWIALVVVLGGGGTALWLTGNLPLGSSAQTAAAADSTAVEVAEDGETPEDEEKVLPVPVELARVDNRGISSYYRAASVIEADRLVDLVCRTSGVVQAVNVEEGDWVTEGQILAELENEREKIQLRKAELSLRDQTRQLERSEQMLDQELVSQQAHDDVESAWKLAEAERDLARIALEDTRVRAPFTGRVTDRKIVAGQQVPVNTAAFTLGDFEPLRVRAYLPEAVARKVSAGQRVLVDPESSDESVEAVIERISPVVDPATSTVRLTMLLADGSAETQVGGFVKIRITTDAHHDALAIPKLALVEEGALRNVFVAEADTVRKIEIETGLYDETHVEVLEGLFAGDMVVTMGQGGLRTGSHIRVLNAEAVDYQTDEPEDETANEDAAMTALARNE